MACCLQLVVHFVIEVFKEERKITWEHARLDRIGLNFLSAAFSEAECLKGFGFKEVFKIE